MSIPLKTSKLAAHIILALQLFLIGVIFYIPFYERSYSNINFWPITYIQFAGIVLCLLGSYLFLSSIFTMKTNFEIRAEQRKTADLVTQWPFSMVRNPMYLSGFILTTGWSLFFNSYLAFFLGLVLLFVLILKIKFEEHFLKKQFGKSYIDYMTSVPRLWPRKFSIWK